MQRGWLFWLDVVVSAVVRGVRARRRRFGAIAAILWELAEYVAFICNSDELDTAYTDTLGDMMLGLGGSAVAALLTTTLYWARSSSEPRARARDGAPLEAGR